MSFFSSDNFRLILEMFCSNALQLLCRTAFRERFCTCKSSWRMVLNSSTASASRFSSSPTWATISAKSLPLGEGFSFRTASSSFTYSFSARSCLFLRFTRPASSFLRAAFPGNLTYDFRPGFINLHQPPGHAAGMGRTCCPKAHRGRGDIHQQGEGFFIGFQLFHQSLNHRRAVLRAAGSPG